MKISELLEKLGELQGIHGDIDVENYDLEFGVSFSIENDEIAVGINKTNGNKFVVIGCSQKQLDGLK